MDSFSGTATDTCSPGKTYAIYLKLYFLNYKIITNFAVGIMTNINKYYILKIKANEKVILYDAGRSDGDGLHFKDADKAGGGTCQESAGSVLLSD